MSQTFYAGNQAKDQNDDTFSMSRQKNFQMYNSTSYSRKNMPKSSSMTKMSFDRALQAVSPQKPKIKSIMPEDNIILKDEIIRIREQLTKKELENKEIRVNRQKLMDENAYCLKFIKKMLEKANKKAPPNSNSDSLLEKGNFTGEENQKILEETYHVKQLQNTIRDYKKIIIDKEEELKKLKTNMKCIKLNELNGQVMTKDNIITDLQKENSILKQQNQMYQAKMAELTKYLDKLVNDNKSLKKENKDLNELLTNEKNSSKVFKEQADRGKSKIDSLNYKISTLNNQIKDEGEKNDKLQKENETLKKYGEEKTKYEKNEANDKRQIEKLKKDLSNSEKKREDVESKLNTIMEINDKLTKENNKLNKRNKELKDNEKNTSQEIKGNQDKLSKIENENKSLNDIIDDQKQKMEELEYQNKDLLDKNEKLTDLYQRLQDTVKKEKEEREQKEKEEKERKEKEEKERAEKAKEENKQDEEKKENNEQDEEVKNNVEEKKDS